MRLSICMSFVVKAPQAETNVFGFKVNSVFQLSVITRLSSARLDSAPQSGQGNALEKEQTVWQLLCFLRHSY